MIDREQYRQNLQSLTDEQLVQAGVSIWRDIRYRRPRGPEQASLWGEWSDVAGELTRRGQAPLISEVFRRVREERRQPVETAREFLERTSREIASRK